jgi:nucleoside-diphosphate-sugar epimerase
MRRNILVIGGAGFIGTALVERLIALGHNVTVFDKQAANSANYTIGDVMDGAALFRAMQGQDVVYNLAAEHRDDVIPRSRYDEVNVQGARNICVAAQASGVQTIIFTSSVAVYGNSGQPLDEESPHNYFNDYGRTKSLAEEVFNAWADEELNRRLVIVRPTVVFGPGNRGNVYNLLRLVRSRWFVMIGPGTNHKSMAYVDNVAAFLGYVLSLPGSRLVVNYADMPDFNMNDLIRFVRGEMGQWNSVGLHLPFAIGMILGSAVDLLASVVRHPLPISAVRIQKFCANTQVNASKARATGFKPVVPLAEGLRRMIYAEFPHK